MTRWLTPNIGTGGRVVRGLAGLALLAGAGVGYRASAWLEAALLVSGVFLVFESLRGWCAMRACGIKTKI
ncbi:MAG TPA: YgaP-like transmembrane domain [Gemmatimonadaceae bacterium]|nr:YgaP-like transmembrane domain [Gemmatimonadaceae bacterium]